MPSDPPQLVEMRLQITQSLLEHQIVVQALLIGSAVALCAIGVLGWLAFSATRRCTYLTEALRAAESRHSVETQKLLAQQQTQLERHSIDSAYAMNQMLLACEGIISAVQKR